MVTLRSPFSALRSKVLFAVTVSLVFALTACANASGGGGSNSGGIDSGAKTGSITGKATFSNAADNSGILVFAEAVTGNQTSSVRAALSTGIARAVSARSAAGSTVAVQTTTSSDGSFTLPDLAAGTYTVYAVSNDSSEGAVARTVTVSADTAATVETLVLTATGTVSGTVTWSGASSGNGGILVYIAGTSYMAYTDDSGAFKITGVPAASAYQLCIVAKDGSTKYSSNTGDDSVMNAQRTISWKTVGVTAKTDTAAGAYVWHPYLAETEHVKVESDPNGVKFTVKLPAKTAMDVYNDDDNTRYNPVTNGMGTYTFVYPLVTAGKTYRFHITFSGPLFDIGTSAEYNEYVSCVAGGGLGPYFDSSNASYAQLKPAYTESGNKRLITLPNWTTPAGSLPAFVVGSSARITDYRLHFEFAIGASDWSNTNWFYSRDVNISDPILRTKFFSEGLDLLNSDAYGSNWRTPSQINSPLAYKNFFCYATFAIKVSGYDGDFWINSVYSDQWTYNPVLPTTYTNNTGFVTPASSRDNVSSGITVTGGNALNLSSATLTVNIGSHTYSGPDSYEGVLVYLLSPDGTRSSSSYLVDVDGTSTFQLDLSAESGSYNGTWTLVAANEDTYSTTTISSWSLKM